MITFTTPIVKKSTKGEVTVVVSKKNGEIEAQITDGEMGFAITPIKINSVELAKKVSTLVEKYLLEQKLIKGELYESKETKPPGDEKL